ncbi:MAG: glutamine synthetase beta-grasp domain-containing protein [Planctomycetes bacterium]|nr:glutamine synthetase beta-grasp domain-containing protein [Planctomycetota bacterium]
MFTADDSCKHDIRPLVRKLGKPPHAWQRADLVAFCLAEGIRVVNFRYAGLDGKLKELRLPVNDRAYLERILASGERVDGSSLFPRLFETQQSDLYAVPVYRWAFLNPFAEDELDIVCRFADASGRPCEVTPDNTLATAVERLRRETGFQLRALAELEFYLILDRNHDRFTGVSQRSYHQSAPYLHGRAVADEILRVVSAVTGRVKYCHSEVGYIDEIASNAKELDGKRVEQYELEFDLMPIEDLGCFLAVARWLIRVIADRQGASATYVPKLDEGMAGSGMHLHLALERDGHNVVQDDAGHLSEEALRMIGGLLEHAGPLTAFGNTVTASYLRLVPGQEAPTRICWGERNRASLIRIPLSFRTEERLDLQMNPRETGALPAALARPTIEYRSPDGSAFTDLLLAAVTMCVADGLGSSESSARARRLEVKPGSNSTESIDLEELPTTAVAAAHRLRDHRAFFEARGFSPRLLDIVLRKLESERDEGLTETLRSLPAAERLVRSRHLMHKDLHKH